MHAISIATTALAALVSSAWAGKAIVHNKCDCDIYVWSIANSADVTMETLSSGNSSYSEAFRKNPNGGGISIKVAKLDSQEEITQFEYTVDGETVFYDVSNINGYPFKAEGLALKPSVSTCPTVTCHAGQDCSAAYNLPDDVDTKGCASETDLTMILCPSGDDEDESTPSTDAAADTTSSPEPAASPRELKKVKSWHQANRRRGHSHGHRYQRQ